MPFIKNVAIFAKKVAAEPPIPPLPTAPERFAAAGSTHNAFITSLGRAWGWGGNSLGQVGDNTITDRCFPVSVAGAAKTFLKISVGSGGTHTVALDKNGIVWSWGNNGSGQLGDNTVLSKRTPVSISGATKTIYEIAAGANHTVALDGTGRAWAWGFNSLGQLGDNTVVSQRTPVSVAGTRKTFCKISAGEAHTVAIDKNGGVWAWGNNNGGRLGDNTNINKSTPVALVGATKTFCKISAGGSVTSGIDKNGRAWGWGTNGSGQVGDNTITLRATPVSVLGLVKTFCEISAGTAHTLAIDKNGRAWGWGNNGQGQLADGSFTQRNTPVSITGPVRTFCKISAGDGHSVAIDKNGGVWTWGNATNGRLGNNNYIISVTTPVSIKGAVKTFCQITAGLQGVNAIDKNGRAWGWGLNTVGAVGDNSVMHRYTPVSVCGAVKTFCSIDYGGNYNIALDKNGRLWAWGGGGSGTLGDNSLVSKSTPVCVCGAIKTFCQISAGNAHNLAIEKNGRVWGWGSNFNGQLGDNTSGAAASKLTPVSLAGAAKTFCRISAGNGHSLGIDRYGRAWAWGFNGNGQLGNNEITSRLTPVSVLGATKTFCMISGGTNYSLAIDRYGRAWSWGQNSLGQLGINSQISQRTPVSVLGATKTFCQIIAGDRHSVALDKNGKAWTWGRGDGGELGIGSAPAACLTPVSVYGNRTFCRIGLGNVGGTQITTAIDKNGRVWAWGPNNNGSLGIDSGVLIYTPVRVCTL